MTCAKSCKNTSGKRLKDAKRCGYNNFELMVVIGIMPIVASIAVPDFIG
jgi:Tfp pilus assembly protein FimT